MPTIKRKQLTEKQVPYKHERIIETQPFYNSLSWTRLRKSYFLQHPICEICLQHNKVTSAVDVHHKVPWDRGKTEEEKWKLFLSENNLMSVCEDCHYTLHKKDKQYHLNSLNNLTDKEYKEAHNINID